MSTTTKLSRAKSPRRQKSPEQVVIAARHAVTQSFDEFLSNFTDTETISRIANAAAIGDNADLHRNYHRMRDAAEALNQWHTNDSFLSKDGAPKKLRRSGKLSLTALARIIRPNELDADRIFSDMISFNLVKKTGQMFLPESRSAVVGTPGSLILAHATAAITRLIGTISHNVSESGPPRYERHVTDVRIRASELPLFLRFVEQQGQYLIDSVDDWLAKREIKGLTRNNEVVVGIGTFAWVDPPKPATKRASLRGGAIVPPKE